jgi:hypothetical protein
MPLILAPYTLGAELPAAPGGVAGGGAFYTHRRRWVNALLILCLVLVC